MNVVYVVISKYQTMFYREILHEEYTRVPSERERDRERVYYLVTSQKTPHSRQEVVVSRVIFGVPFVQLLLVCWESIVR